MEKVLPKVFENYANRPLPVLYGLTPSEVINRAIPDKYYYQKEIESAQKERMAINRDLECDNCG